MSRVNAIDAEKKASSLFQKRSKKINKNVEFYRYLRLINIFKQTTFIARSY